MTDEVVVHGSLANRSVRAGWRAETRTMSAANRSNRRKTGSMVLFCSNVRSRSTPRFFGKRPGRRRRLRQEGNHGTPCCVWLPGTITLGTKDPPSVRQPGFRGHGFGVPSIGDISMKNANGDINRRSAKPLRKNAGRVRSKDEARP